MPTTVLVTLRFHFLFPLSCFFCRLSIFLTFLRTLSENLSVNFWRWLSSEVTAPCRRLPTFQRCLQPSSTSLTTLPISSVYFHNCKIFLITLCICLPFLVYALYVPSSAFSVTLLPAVLLLHCWHSLCFLAELLAVQPILCYHSSLGIFLPVGSHCVCEYLLN
jgi:hypothetical protein